MHIEDNYFFVLLEVRGKIHWLELFRYSSIAAMTQSEYNID